MNEAELRKLIESWREYADDHYCQTYNKGMAQGLNKAADELEALLKTTHSARGVTENFICSRGHDMRG